MHTISRYFAEFYPIKKSDILSVQLFVAEYLQDVAVEWDTNFYKISW